MGGSGFIMIWVQNRARRAGSISCEGFSWDPKVCFPSPPSFRPEEARVRIKHEADLPVAHVHDVRVYMPGMRHQHAICEHARESVDACGHIDLLVRVSAAAVVALVLQLLHAHCCLWAAALTARLLLLMMLHLLLLLLLLLLLSCWFCRSCCCSCC